MTTSPKHGHRRHASPRRGTQSLDELRAAAEAQLRRVEVLARHEREIVEARDAYQTARHAYLSDLGALDRARRRTQASRSVALQKGRALEAAMVAAVAEGASPAHVEAIAGRSLRRGELPAGEGADGALTPADAGHLIDVTDAERFGVFGDAPVDVSEVGASGEAWA